MMIFEGNILEDEQTYISLEGGAPRIGLVTLIGEDKIEIRVYFHK